MLSFVYTLAVLLASCLLTSAAPLKTQHEYYPWNPVMFNSFPKHINADSEITLSWKGGSGKGYEVYYVPQFDGPGAYQSVDIATTTQHSIKWKTPHKGSYPADTSFVIAVRDLTEGSGAVWYDLTGRVPFVQ